MSTHVRVLATLLILLAAAQVDAPAASPVQEYLAARDAYLAKFKDSDIIGDERAGKAHEAARRDLETRLRGIVGASRIEGVSAEGKINLETLSPGFIGFGLLDGLVYRSADEKTRIVVTTDDLLGRWLRANKSDVPQTAAAALKSDSFYNGALYTDAAFFRYAELPVARPADARLAFAMLIARGQDLGPRTPDEIIVSLLRGGRVFIVIAPADAKVGGMPDCDKIWQKASKQAEEAADAGTGPQVETFDKLREDGDRAFRRCFAARAPREGYFPALVKQARGLISMLPLK
jgi:hypothetical protein